MEEFSSDVELRDLKLEFRTWDEEENFGAKTPPLDFHAHGGEAFEETNGDK